MSAESDGCIDPSLDSISRPTPEMRGAMADAKVGDDWYGDDPTVDPAAGGRGRADRP